MPARLPVERGGGWTGADEAARRGQFIRIADWSIEST